MKKLPTKVELWVDDEKKLSHTVENNFEIVTKVALFREIAIREGYFNWQTYVVKPVYIPGQIIGNGRHLTKEQQKKWNEKFPRIIEESFKINK